MIEYNCISGNAPQKKHKWIYHTPAEWSLSGCKPTYLSCEYCHKLISMPELIQYEAIQKQTIATKVLVITTIIAFVGLIISIIFLFIK